MSSLASKMLSKELMRLAKDPVPGFTVEPASDDLYTWIVGMFGPPDTIYQGGYFKARMKFPESYPMDPPSMVMMQPMWHPNIYEDGRLCISILHAPGDDAQSGELASERWNPTQSVATVLLSVISMLNEPNISSPANVDASVMYRNSPEEYNARVLKQVEDSKLVAAREGVHVPCTVDEYVVKPPEPEAAPADYETSDDEKYVVHLDEDSEVDSDDDGEASDTATEDGDTAAEDEEMPLVVETGVEGGAEGVAEGVAEGGVEAEVKAPAAADKGAEAAASSVGSKRERAT